ncbi:MAG: biotin transporter BioY, partial [Armatimonadetes bacterium]|nr:biotin transporter BioY [Armatimonadota bacterium]
MVPAWHRGRPSKVSYRNRALNIADPPSLVACRVECYNSGSRRLPRGCPEWGASSGIIPHRGALAKGRSALLRTLTVSLRATAVQRGTWVTVAAVCGLALTTALAAHVRLHLPFSPVPVTLQTFVVLLGGAVLGARAGVAGQLLYLG